MADKTCDKDTYSSLLGEILVGDDLVTDRLGGAAGAYFYLP